MVGICYRIIKLESPSLQGVGHFPKTDQSENQEDISYADMVVVLDALSYQVTKNCVKNLKLGKTGKQAACAESLKNCLQKKMVWSCKISELL